MKEGSLSRSDEVACEVGFSNHVPVSVQDWNRRLEYGNQEFWGVQQNNEGTGTNKARAVDREERNLETASDKCRHW